MLFMPRISKEIMLESMAGMLPGMACSHTRDQYDSRSVSTVETDDSFIFHLELSQLP